MANQSAHTIWIILYNKTLHTMPAVLAILKILMLVAIMTLLRAW